jgi:hypothetical protein
MFILKLYITKIKYAKTTSPKLPHIKGLCEILVKAKY